MGKYRGKWVGYSAGAMGGGTGRDLSPKSQKSAIIKEKWYKISWVYLQIEKLCQNSSPPQLLSDFSELATPLVGQKLCMNFAKISVHDFP